MASQAPDVALGVAFEHVFCATPDVIDVVHLPGGVMQEVYRGLNDKQVVGVRRAPHKGALTFDGVANFETDSFGEEFHTGKVVGCTQYGMPESTRGHGVLTIERGYPVVSTF